MYIPQLILQLLPTLSLLQPTSKPTPKKGAASCEVQLCADIGASFLQKGGSAADAMVGMVACVGTIANYHSGFGGGGFALVRSPDGTFESIDFRGAAPGALNGTIFEDDPTKSTMVGGLAVLVPGELRGLEAIHKKHGKLPWKDLFQPAIKLASDGFEINRDLFVAMNLTRPESRGPTNFKGESLLYANEKLVPGQEPGYNESFLITDSELSKVFAPNGTLLSVGSLTTRPTYARALQAVADHGPDAFYNGKIAEDIVASVRKNGGVLSLDDMANYQAHVRPALSMRYRNHTVYAPQAPSSGSLVLSTLNTMNGYEPFGREADPSDVNIHRLVESMKFAYGERTLLGDIGYTNASTLQRAFLLPSTAQHVRSLINDHTTHEGDYYDPEGWEVLDDKGTSALVVGDEDGLAVSVTTTVNLYWGSRIMTPEYGVILNDGVDDFSVKGRRNAFGYIPSPANYIVPFKRPLSSMSPLIIDDPSGKFMFASSCAGGSRIISAQIQMVLNAVDRGMSALQALTAPRLHDQVYPAVTAIEQDMPALGFKGFSMETRDYLSSLGHNVTYVPTGLSVACAVKFSPESGWEAAGDPRKFDTGSAVSSI
ncbi:Gamma-glutamyltransferase [Phaffia rhodozyma]|uniref:Glutathione hydrolase n=1 Tax=Phaffia rhodozyma TaxID=264483 RepID=A0A0F7SS40_PHARH|nr:Gamma-glutamyltransferase [Phaffia rhodozyma]